MDMLGQIGGIASLGSLILSRPAKIRRGADTYDVRAMLKKGQTPYRANENRRPYDALFRLDRQSSPVEPQQNDVLRMLGQEWIVWRILPSAAGSHWHLECMAPATVAAIPVSLTNVKDIRGGFTKAWTPLQDQWFLCKVREANADRQMTAESDRVIGRLRMSYAAVDAPPSFGEDWRVEIDGRGYEILSISVDDENPLWRNALLARGGDNAH